MIGSTCSYLYRIKIQMVRIINSEMDIFLSGLMINVILSATFKEECKVFNYCLCYCLWNVQKTLLSLFVLLSLNSTKVSNNYILLLSL